LARINQDLIARIAWKLGVSAKSVYPRVQRVVNETGLERHLAAILLAMRNDINVNRFSTKTERADLSTFLGGRGHRQRDQDDEPAPVPAQPARSAGGKKTTKRRRTKGKTVFVVHGRDVALREAMFAFLRALQLHPLEWEQAIRQAKKGANPFVGDVIDRVMDQAQAVLVMFSPDDLVQLKSQFVSGHEKDREGKPCGQARPNVLFEAGLAMGRHQEKTVLVQIGDVKPFSDIGGRHMMHFDGSYKSRHALVGRLKMLHCDMDEDGQDWMTVGTFEPTEGKPSKKKSGK
jgi:predicted nucleotide-binding protein